jgi:predicted amidohydrolase
MEVTIALAQYPVSQHANVEAWQQHITRWVTQATEKGANVLVFPEYGSMELVSVFPEAVQSDLHGQLLELQQLLPVFTATFRELAEKHRCVIVAPSFPVNLADKTIVNRVFVFGPAGEGHQDKWFMTRFENEEWGISSNGRSLTLFETDWCTFGVQICYDIEFPVGSHRLAQSGAGLIVVPSCTETIRGATRVHIGARARAMEQQVFTAVAQTINEALWSPAVDMNYGYAAIYSSPDKDLPEEGILAIGTPEKPQWIIEKIDFEQNAVIRTNGQVFNYMDMQRLQLTTAEAITIHRIRL